MSQHEQDPSRPDPTETRWVKVGKEDNPYRAEKIDHCAVGGVAGKSSGKKC